MTLSIYLLPLSQTVGSFGSTGVVADFAGALDLFAHVLILKFKYTGSKKRTTFKRRTSKQKEGLHHGWLGTRVDWLRAFECVFYFSLKDFRTIYTGYPI